MAIHKMPMMIRAAKGDCALKKIKLQLRLRMSCTANSTMAVSYTHLANKGVHCVSNKNSLRGTRAKNTEDSEISTQRMPMVVRMLTAAQRRSTPSMIFSFTLISCAFPVGEVQNMRHERTVHAAF